MRKVGHDEKGFTIIETILVLSIVVVITSSIIYVTSSKIDEVEERRFFRQFHLDVQRLQSIAIGDYKYSYLKFEGNGTKYVARSANVPLFEHKVPTHMRLSMDSNLKEIEFNPNGTIRQFGTLTFETKRGYKTVTVYIGNGRLNYEE